MIKKLEPEDIAEILHQDNPDMKGIDLGQWVQFLMQNYNNIDMLLLGEINNDKKLGHYLIAIAKPKRIILLYISEEIVKDIEFKRLVLEWAKANMINKVVFKSNFIVDSWDVE